MCDATQDCCCSAVWLGWVGLGLLCSLASCLVMLSHDFQPLVWDLPDSHSCCGSKRCQENVLVAELNPLSHQFILVISKWLVEVVPDMQKMSRICCRKFVLQSQLLEPEPELAVPAVGTCFCLALVCVLQQPFCLAVAMGASR